jgi:ParB-like chromosome segregation protein Spo0J
VPIGMLRPADSPRFIEMDIGHAQALAESEAELPPILVRRATMRVVDGMHRLTAAELRGQENICVHFFEGDEDEAFLLAVESNVSHGLPLTIAERRAAAARILRSHPEMSDRSIAAISGIAAKTVAGIRSATDNDPHLNARVGRDGRVRPLNYVEGRRLAGELFVDQPEASLRKIARQAGISLGTARDVRERIRRGDDPTLPPKQPQVPGVDNGASARAVVPSQRRPVEIVDVQATLEHLFHDPSMRYSDSGRSLLRWLHRRALSSNDWEQIVAQIPPHCAILVARVARGSATAWNELANALDQRVRDCA